MALPASKIATLSSGEFVGITADSPDQPMPLKAFHCQIQLDTDQTRNDLPLPHRKLPKEIIDQTFAQIQIDVKGIVDNRMAQMREDSTLNRLILNPKVGTRRRRQTKL
jgi:hypothetical protein